MLRKGIAILALALIAVLVVSSLVVAQAEEVAEGPDNARTPNGEWTMMPSDGTHWYAFRDEGDEHKIEIEMQTWPNGAVDFEVWTPDDLRAWADEEEFEPVGRSTLSCGCELDDSVGKFNWCGSFIGENEYLIIVESQSDETSFYTLEVKGEDVSFRDGAAMEEPAAAVEAEPMAAAAPAVAPVILKGHEGESPAYALPVSEELTQLEKGQMHWYAFTYDNDVDYETLELFVEATPGESVIATVRNQEQAQLWAREGENEHLGCCTIVYKYGDRDDEEKMPFMHWSADDLASGQYYVVIELAEGFEGPATYQLQVMGEGFMPG